MVSALDSGSSGLGSSPGQGHCVVFLGKTLYSHSASLHPGVQMGTSKCTGDNPAFLKVRKCDLRLLFLLNHTNILFLST